MNAYRGVTVYLHTFLTSEIDGGELLNFTRLSFYPREKTLAYKEHEAAEMRTPDRPARSLVTLQTTLFNKKNIYYKRTDEFSVTHYSIVYNTTATRFQIGLQTW
jgi:hypothetical protein